MEFREFEINNFLGIATSTRHPNKSECQECLNFDTRYIDGDLTLRPGFSSKYAAPVNADHRTKLSNITYLNFANFIPEGTTTEVTVWVGRGTLAGEAGTLNGNPSSIDILVVFTSHQFNGTSWVTKNWDGTTDGKYWLNHCVLTSITLSGIASPNTWEITLDMNTNQFASDSLNNWSVYNVTKDDVAQVIDSVLTGSSMRIDITKSVHNWEDEDILILMRNFIPYTELRELANATASEVVFHKVLNDLRIGFGGKANRIGLSIGYRKKYFNINNVKFNSYSGAQIEGLATVNNIVLNTYTVLPDIRDYRISIGLDGTAGNEIAAGNYFFMLTGLLDGFNEILLAKSSYKLDAPSRLTISLETKLGAHNKRLTHVKLYASANSVTDAFPKSPYYLITQMPIASTVYGSGLFEVDNQGYLILGGSREVRTGTDAASVTGEANSIGNFYGASIQPISYDYSGAAPSAPTGGGSYGIKITNSTGAAHSPLLIYTQSGLFRAGREYEVSFAHIATTANLQLEVFGIGSVTSDTSWKTSTFRILKEYDGTSIFIRLNDLPNGGYFAIDLLSIKEFSPQTYTDELIPGDGAEITDILGYVPTFDIVKSWDQAIVTQGRTFFVNPYIDQRYENKIFSSHISGAGAFMYDVASAERYIDLENFDGNKLVGIEILPNLQFVAFKTNGSQRVDPNTGQIRGINFGDGCISRRSIVNFGDRIVWCGENDIYMTDGLNITSIADKTIREAYRALTTKANIIATREEKDNAYRFFTGDTTNKTEYIFTKRGWVKRSTGASIYPTAYYLESSGQVNFLHNGIIYDDDESTRDPGSISIIGEWKSIDIDAELLGSEITQRDFFYIASMWLDYTRNVGTGDDPNMQMILTMDGNVVYTDTFQTIPGRKKYFIQIPTEKYNGRRFNLTVKIVSDSNEVKAKHISIHSVGVIWKLVKAGHYN